jgi:uncharacterized repeat protein (TIGR01451 family)
MRLGHILLFLAAGLPARSGGIALPLGSYGQEAQLFGQGDPVGQQGAEFGVSVAVAGDTMVVGAAAHDTGAGVDAGAVFVFVRSGTSWSLQQMLAASDAAASDLFGTGVGISGDTVIVGSPSDDTPAGPDAGSAYVFVRSGTTWTEQQKIVASDGASGDEFGRSVSISADTVLVGAQTHQGPGGVNSGAAYVFVRSGATWSEQQPLAAPDGLAGDLFGCAVAVSADTAVVGACTDDTAAGPDAGSAYVFVRSGVTWTSQQHLFASDAAAGDAFGCSVAVAGDTAVAGACLGQGPAGGTDTGSAYVFVRAGTTWTEQQEISATDAGSNGGFGYSTSISGDTVAVSARYADTAGGIDAGAAYVFVRSGSTWSLEQKLAASDGAPGDFFGTSASISGDTVAVGASSADTPGGFGFNTGAAYVYVRAGSAWSEQQKLRPPDTHAGDSFGRAAALSGDTLVVGAWADDTLGAVDSGAAYVFVRSGTAWSLQQKLRPFDSTTSARFGWSVSISGETLVIGAPGAEGAGAAYVFLRSGTTWYQQQKLTAPPGALDFGRSVALSGDALVVGAPLGGAGAAGSAFVFVRSGATWSPQQELVASDAAGGDELGASVSISADTAAVGAPGDDNGPADTGSLYVFVRGGTTWTEQQKLLSDGGAGNSLGASVSISGNTVVGGAPGNAGPGGAQAGSAYVFVRAGTVWTQQQQLFASDGAPGDALGSSASVSGDALVVGATSDDTPGGANAGSASVFVRSGSTWTEQPKLTAPDGTADDAFGTAVAVSGTTVVAGAPQADDPQGGPAAGSAYVFRDSGAPADLAVTKTDGLGVVIPGDTLTYTIVVSNEGPSAAVGAVVLDTLPAALLGATWTCSPSAGSTCTASGSGSLDEVVSLPVGGTLTYTVTGTVDPAATGFVVNMATVAGTTDPDPADNSATDGTALAPEADLAVTKTDSADPVSPNDPLTYTVVVTNGGLSDATGVTLTDVLPAGVTFVASTPGPPTCTLAASTLTCNLGVVTAGSPSTVAIDVTVNPAAAGILVNTATVAGDVADPDLSNNSASASTAVGQRDGELAHGTDLVLDLAATPGPTADADVFRIAQKPYSSYEVVVEGTSGDIGAGSGPLLERLAPDGSTVVQTSLPVGAGPSRSLRWMNTTAGEIQGDSIRVRSAGCGTDCGPDDVYRIRAYETTYAAPRFNNAGSQFTVLLLQNPTNGPISGEAYFRAPSGALVAIHPFTLAPKAALVLNTAALPGAGGISGAIVVAHDGGYADLVGKTVALEPATGFSFDTPLEPRVR